MTADLRQALADLAELAPTSLDRPSAAAVGRRQRTRRVAVTTACALLVVAAGAAGATALTRGSTDALVPAAPQQPDPPQGSLGVGRASFLPATPPGTPSPAGLAGPAALSGDPTTGCLWLSGSGGVRLPVLVRHDTAVADFTADPFVIRDGATVLAREGDPVQLAGGSAPDGFAGAVPGCPADGEPFIGALVAEPGPDSAPGGRPSAPPPDGQPSRTVRIYLTSQSNTDCLADRPVERRIPQTSAVATAALTELFSGRISDQERAAGLQSGFSPATADLLNGLRIADGTAYVDLNGTLRDEIAYASTSCGSAVFGSAIRNTLLQFPTVTQVRYAFDGDPRAFVEWSQGGCPDEPIPPGDPCDPLPWQSGPAS